MSPYLSSSEFTSSCGCHRHCHGAGQHEHGSLLTAGQEDKTNQGEMTRTETGRKPKDKEAPNPSTEKDEMGRLGIRSGRATQVEPRGPARWTLPRKTQSAVEIHLHEMLCVACLTSSKYVPLCPIQAAYPTDSDYDPGPLQLAAHLFSL